MRDGTDVMHVCSVGIECAVIVGPTSDHAEIRRWAEIFHATPAEVRPFVFDSMPSVMRFLSGEAGATGTAELRPITWNSFLARFDLLRLVMLYDDEEPTFTILQDEGSRYKLAPGER